MRDASGDQCLRFYYYFTVYDDYNWNQQIQLWIRSNNHSDTRYSIGNLTVNDMKYNGWHFHYVTFKRQSSSDTVTSLIEKTRKSNIGLEYIFSSNLISSLPMTVEQRMF